MYIAECRSLGRQGAAARHQRVAGQLHGDVARRGRRRGHPAERVAGGDLVRAVGGAQRRRRARRPAARRARRPTAPTPASTSSPIGSPSRCSTSGRSSRSIKAGAFDSLGHPRRGLLGRLRAGDEHDAEPPPRARARGDEPVRRRRCSPRAMLLRRTAAGPRRRVRQGRAVAGREGDARPVRVRPPAVRQGGGAAPQGRAEHRRARRPRRRDDGAHRRRRHRVEPAVHQARRPDGDVHARGPRRRDRGDAVPADAHRAWATSWPTT